MTEEKNISTPIVKKKRNVMMYVFITIFAIAVIALGAVYYQKNVAGKSKQQIIEKAFDYINKNLSGGSELTLGEIDKDTKKFYRFVIKVGENSIPTYVSTDGKLITYNEQDITKTEENPSSSTQQDLVYTFAEVKENEICRENGKPIVYFFGSKSCPHCEWEKPIIAEVVKSFGDKISYHENIDSQNDLDVFSKFNQEGGIPTIIVGCKYYRIGSGEGSGADKEKENLKGIIDMILK
ncbi:thioredoxin family protein [bacterium]|nr:thioredoxin family protein [bacterium]